MVAGAAGAVVAEAAGWVATTAGADVVAAAEVLAAGEAGAAAGVDLQPAMLIPAMARPARPAMMRLFFIGCSLVVVCAS